MPVVEREGRMKKELSLFGVFALSTGTTLSAGFFLLPGLAAERAGPAMILCYLLAAVPMIPAILSIIELSTAMPRAGGAYYYVDRSLGPVMGTIGGFGTWFALVAKTAFALVGMGAYISLFVGDYVSTIFIASLLALAFGALNLYGAKESALFQVILVVGLLVVLIGFIGDGIFDVERVNFQNFFKAGGNDIFATAGLVYISYVGVTKVASVSEEVKDPDRTLPRAIIASFIVSVLIYGLGTTVMVGVLGDDLFHANHIDTPVAAVAEQLGGKFGKILISLAALAAFSSVANAGILSASRYPLAMSRDRILPKKIGAVNAKRIPALSVVITTIAVMGLLWLDLEKIVKLASATQLLMFAMLNVAVIMMRESKIESYDPGFKSPWYPYVQIVGIILPLWFISSMGWLAVISTTSLITIGASWYFYYANKHVARRGAVFHVFERLGQARFTGLDSELRSILKEKGLRPDDPFEEVVETATMIDANPAETFESIVEMAADAFAKQVGCSSVALRDGFLEGTRVGATPVAGGVALPHLRRPEVLRPHLVIVRISTGVEILVPDSEVVTTHEPARAIFFLLSPEDDPGRHLRTLAELAERVDDASFMDEWLAARNPLALSSLLIRRDRYMALELSPESMGRTFIGKTLRDIDLPQGCLVVLVHREGDSIVPTARMVFQKGDRLSIIGNPESMEGLRKIVEPSAQTKLESDANPQSEDATDETASPSEDD